MQQMKRDCMRMLDYWLMELTSLVCGLVQRKDHIPLIFVFFMPGYMPTKH